jgi:uncharacterized protein YbaR (Trm112 family)
MGGTGTRRVKLSVPGGSIGMDPPEPGRTGGPPAEPPRRRTTVAVSLDPRLMEILACPSDDHAPLRAGAPGDPEADVLTCTSCGRGYSVVDGIPVLLLDEASPPVDTPGG